MSDITKVNIPDNIDNLTVGKEPPYFPYPDLSREDEDRINDVFSKYVGPYASGIYYEFPLDGNYQESIYAQEGKMWVTDVKSSG